MGEPLPLARIHDEILQFLRNREDAVLFGAQAVNAYVDESRMTQDVGIVSTRAKEFAEELRSHLAKVFSIAARVREVAGGAGFRIYQLRKPKNRHLADIRHVAKFPPTQVVAEVRVPVAEELIAQKLISMVGRSAQPKGDTDRRDLKVLLLAHPQLKTETGAVLDRLIQSGSDRRATDEWKRVVAMEIQSPSDADEFED